MRFARSYCLMPALLLLAGTVVLPAQEGPRKESSETVARPRTSKSEEAKQQEKIPSEFKKDKEDVAPTVSFKSDVLTVDLDVAVIDNKGNFIPQIPRGHFRVLEDGVPQQITNFSMGEAPMTVAMVIEFSNLFQNYWGETWYQTLTAAYGFLETLKPEDYVAVVAYDMRPEILSDFSTDKRQAYDAMQRLRIAAYSESNLFDAITDTADRMSGIEGRKAIVLISSGIDTFSKLTFDKTRKALQTAGVPIYAIGLMQALREWYDARGYLGSIARLDFLQADNQLRTFANETGGQAYFPRFYGEFPSIFASIAQALRNQYSLAYQPTNQARDGKYRKIKVELVNPATNEALRVTDQKGKSIKYRIIAKAGYTAPREVE
ncbi:MAG: VWA domain-containing protein [Bryobacteraceae bacterium]|nr:VWA domain-containing protein [Bryobacterales bacterium]MEB2361933.1 VWA domain-containing protein [Bryobacterales bacterium]NUN02699.1 VWA domain-containing protein [Bryobacteraceae bacterium]